MAGAAIPDIRIRYAWLLAGEASVVMHEKYGGEEPLAPHEHFQGVAEKYRVWWAPHSDKIIHGMCDILDLEFRQKSIDVYVAPWFNPISDPLVVGPAFYTEDTFVNTLTHELIHRLLTDNTAMPFGYNSIPDWERLFGENHTQSTLVHIPVHAVMKKLYLEEVGRPDLFELDMRVTENNPPYADAWKYVNENGYSEIIAKFLTLRRP